MKTYEKFALIFCLFLLVGPFTSTASAKSVYVISSHTASAVRVYTIDGDQLIHEEEYNGGFPNNGSGAIDLALNDDDDVLFASYDSANVIEMINSKTMEHIGGITVAAQELAGLTFYQDRNWLIAAQREPSGSPDPTLYVYYYDSEAQSLEQIHTHVLGELESGALGICLDEVDMRLYVTSYYSSLVRYYDMTIQNNLPVFTYAGYVENKLDDEAKDAVGVSVYNDGQGTKYLYAAGYNHGGHSYVIRTDLVDPEGTNGRLGAYMGSGTMAADVAVNEDTGLLYVTTLGTQSSLRVYTPLAWTSDPYDCLPTQTITAGFSSPAGVIVGSQYKSPNRIWLDKEQISPDPNTICSSPDDYVTYEICYHNGPESETNVVLTDTLPRGATFISADPDTGVYDLFTHTYTWSITDMDPNESTQCVEITVQISNWAQPAGELINIAEIESDKAYTRTEAHTPLCCWGGDIIYVDITAIGAETGVDWDNAYTDLNDALARAALGCGDEIWVARGTYSPGNNYDDTFTIPDGVEVYGGFAGTEILLEQRDFVRNKTILSGYTGAASNNEKVVTMGNNSVLDGFSINYGEYFGIYSLNDDCVITNCEISKNNKRGFYCQNGNFEISWCYIKENGTHGIYHYGYGKTANIHNCRISDNTQNGVFSEQSTPTILNCMISNNGFDGAGYYGIRLYQPWSSPIIRNNTIVLNHNEGIHFTGDYPSDITNCILWANHDNDDQYYNCAFTYSCILDPNHPAGDAPGSDIPDPVTHNITAYPSFAYDDPNHCHIHDTSPCKDRGINYTGSSTDTDIDGDNRVINSIIDMGCDEVACSDIEHDWDFNEDSIINLLEFAPFAAAWLKDDSDQDWTTHARCDFDTDDDVDLDDLCLFSEVWLWQACWRDADSYFALMMRGGGGDGENLLMSSPEMLSATELEAAKLTRWREMQPAFEPTGQTLLWQIEDIIDWLEKLWATDPDFRKDITEEDFLSFVKKLYESKSELEVQLEKQNELQ